MKSMPRPSNSEKRMRPCRGPWHVDETYVRVDGQWRYLYRAVDSTGQTIDFLLSAKRDKQAAKRFFKRTLGRENTRNPRAIVTNRLKSYPGALREMKRKDKLRRFVQHRRGRWLNNRVEIGQSQMTKTDLLARPVRWHHVANLDLAIGDDHSVDQELDQGSPLLEGGFVQALPHPSAELPDGAGQPRELLLPVRLRFELPRLLLELLLAPFEVTPAPPVFVERHHAGEIGVRQTLELLPQTGLAAAQPLLPRLHAVELLLADEGRDLGHQDPFLAGRVHPAHGRVLARRRRRAPLQRAAAVPAVAVDQAGIGRVGQQGPDAGEVPAGQPRRRPDPVLLQPPRERAEAVRLLRVPGEHLAHDGRLGFLDAYAGGIARTVRIDPVAEGRPRPRQHQSRLQLALTTTAHALADQRALVLRDRTSDLQQQLVVRVMAHGAVQKPHGTAVPFQLLQQQDLMDVVACHTVRRGDHDQIERAGGAPHGRAGDRGPDASGRRRCSRHRERYGRGVRPSLAAARGPSGVPAAARPSGPAPGAASTHERRAPPSWPASRAPGPRDAPTGSSAGPSIQASTS